MPKLNPAIRTGLIWAGVHQAWALCGLAMLWISSPLFVLSGLFLGAADYLMFSVVYALGAAAWEPALPDFLPRINRGVSSAHTLLPNLSPRETLFLGLIVLTLGALQWFLIGYGFGLLKASVFWTRLRDEIKANLSCCP